MSDDIVRVWETIRTTLDEMGKEACAEGRRYGLRCYGSYCREKLPGSFREEQSEEPITEGLARKLCGKSVHGETLYALPERRYPTGQSQERCDVVVWLDGINYLWIECKTAYKECLGQIGSSYDYEGDSHHEPKGKGSWKAAVGCIPADVGKLKRLAESRTPVTQYIGILLLGFDREENPIAEDALYSLLPDELNTQWTHAHGKGRPNGIIRPDGYLARAKKGFRERLWFWYRAVNE